MNCSMFTVHCTLYTIQYTLYNIHYTIYTIQYTLYIAYGGNSVFRAYQDYDVYCVYSFYSITVCKLCMGLTMCTVCTFFFYSITVCTVKTVFVVLTMCTVCTVCTVLSTFYSVYNECPGPHSNEQFWMGENRQVTASSYSVQAHLQLYSLRGLQHPPHLSVQWENKLINIFFLILSRRGSYHAPWTLLVSILAPRFLHSNKIQGDPTGLRINNSHCFYLRWGGLYEIWLTKDLAKNIAEVIWISIKSYKKVFVFASLGLKPDILRPYILLISTTFWKDKFAYISINFFLIIYYYIIDNNGKQEQTNFSWLPLFATQMILQQAAELICLSESGNVPN